MNLVPANEPNELRAFEDTLEQQILKLQKLQLDFNPLTCRKEFLPHLALMYSLDISSLYVDEQRQYIYNAFEIRRYKGTLWSVKKALEVVFENAVIQEWYDYKAEPFHFRASLTLGSDTNKIYDEAKFKKTRELLESAKNARSVFDGFEVKYPLNRLNINIGGGSAINIKLQNKLDFSSHMELNISGGVVWTV